MDNTILKTILFVRRKAASYLTRLINRPSARKKLDELIWAHTFDFTIRDSEWFRRQSLNPGHWAIGFPGLYILYRTLSEMKPDSVLEFGLGESSKLTFQYASYYPGKQLTIIEQDAEWRDVFCRTVFDVSKNVRVLPLETRGKGSTRHHSYKDLMPAIAGKKYDLVVIDGPWGSPRNSRDQILDIIREGLLADRFVILMDDANRRGEKDTIRAIKKLLSKQNREYASGCYRGMKDTIIICSSELHFLTTL